MAMIVAAQVAAIRASAVAITAQCDALLAALSAAAPTPPSDGPCQHQPERRTPAARMGAPGAWTCECGAEGGGG